MHHDPTVAKCPTGPLVHLLADESILDTEFLASSEPCAPASIRSINHVQQAAIIGADVATIPPATMKGLVKHPLTDKGLDAFLADWARTGQKIGK